MLSGTALILDIDRTAIVPGQLAFWWLGQLGFVLKASGGIIYLDPFLSPHPRRQVPPLLAPDQIKIGRAHV